MRPLYKDIAATISCLWIISSIYDVDNRPSIAATNSRRVLQHGPTKFRPELAGSRAVRRMLVRRRRAAPRTRQAERQYVQATAAGRCRPRPRDGDGSGQGPQV